MTEEGGRRGGRVGAFARTTLAIAELEARKVRRDPTELLTRAVQPAIWLLVFGQVLARSHAIPTSVPYLAYLAPGILGQSVLFVSIFYGIAVIWERDLGLLQKFLASPAPRSAIVLGKGLSAGVRSLSQAVLVYALAAALGVALDWNPLAVVGALLFVGLGASLFATLSVLLAAAVRSRERFLGVGQLLTMPLFFASSAVYPIALMPAWLRPLAWANPLTYEVDALRRLMLAGQLSWPHLAVDAAVMLGATAAAVALGGRVYARVVAG
jgi:ABC-2 type transport system permease protein